NKKLSSVQLNSQWCDRKMGRYVVALTLVYPAISPILFTLYGLSFYICDLKCLDKMIKRLLLLACLHIPFISLGQHAVEGTIFNSSGVVVQLNGDYYTYFKNNKNAIGKLNGQTVMENIDLPP